jgi:hypothetical protein
LLRKQDGSSLRKAFGQFVALSDMSSRLRQTQYSKPIDSQDTEKCQRAIARMIQIA